MSAKEKGTVLITTIIILAFLSVMGMSLVALLYSRVSYSLMEVDRLKALYMAEAGLAKSIWELKSGNDSDGDGIGNIPKTGLADGFYWAKHDFQNAVIMGAGEVNGVERRVQIKYSAI